MGSSAQAAQELTQLIRVKAVVKSAGTRALAENRDDTDAVKTEAKTGARHQEAIKQAIKLVKPADTVGIVSTAALFDRLDFSAFDVWAFLPDGTFLGQSKGVQDPLAPTAVPYAAKAKGWLNKMVYVAQGKRANGKPGTKKWPAPLPSLKPPLFLELLVARPIEADCLGKMQEQLADYNACVLVIGSDQLETALGPIFGGIAARCVEVEDEEEAGDDGEEEAGDDGDEAADDGEEAAAASEGLGGRRAAGGSSTQPDPGQSAAGAAREWECIVA